MKPKPKMVPDHVKPLRAKVLRFMEEHVYPLERRLRKQGGWPSTSGPLAFSPEVRALQAEAKRQGLWALGHPRELGGGGMPFAEYLHVNEVQGRAEALGGICLGTHSLQDALMLARHASAVRPVLAID